MECPLDKLSPLSHVDHAQAAPAIIILQNTFHQEAFDDLQKAYSLDPEIPNLRKYVQMAVKAMGSA